MGDEPLVVVRGGGDLGTACALRLYRAGLRVLVVEQVAPTAVRRTVAFAEAVFEGKAKVEELTAMRIASANRAEDVLSQGYIPVLVDPDMSGLLSLSPDILIDALMAKKNQGMARQLAPTTVAIGPGFVAGVDVDAVVETNRGTDLGRVIWRGSAQAATHVPGAVGGHTHDRVLRATTNGIIRCQRSIGDLVEEGETIAQVATVPIRSPFAGIVRGLIHNGLEVAEGTKIGDIDPRKDPSLCYRVSDKALAVGGGVLEAVLILLGRQGWKISRPGSEARRV